MAIQGMNPFLKNKFRLKEIAGAAAACALTAVCLPGQAAITAVLEMKQSWLFGSSIGLSSLIFGFSLVKIFDQATRGYSNPSDYIQSSRKPILPEKNQYRNSERDVESLSHAAGLQNTETIIFRTGGPAYANSRENRVLLNAVDFLDNGKMKDKFKRAVIAHEVAHIKNRDGQKRLMMTCLHNIAMACTTGSVFLMEFESMDRIAARIACICVIPFILRYMERQQEFLADRDGALLTVDNKSLYSFLFYYSSRHKAHRQATENDTPKAKPSGIITQYLTRGLRTHPTTSNRAQALRDLKLI